MREKSFYSIFRYDGGFLLAELAERLRDLRWAGELFCPPVKPVLIEMNNTEYRVLSEYFASPPDYFDGVPIKVAEELQEGLVRIMNCPQKPPDRTVFSMQIFEGKELIQDLICEIGEKDFSFIAIGNGEVEGHLPSEVVEWMGKAKPGDRLNYTGSCSTRRLVLHRILNFSLKNTEGV